MTDQRSATDSSADRGFRPSADDFEIHVIATGGTIDKEYTVAGDLDIGSPMVSDLLAAARIDFPFTSESACTKDSLDLTDDDREVIRQRVAACPGRRVLITHGTDTMVETAAVLRDIPGKVVVLTGAMMPARMLDTDAPFNLGLAVAALQSCPDGIYIAMSGRIFAADSVRKDRERGRFVDL